MTEESTSVVPVRLHDGKIIHIEVRDLGGRQKVSDLKDLSFENVIASIEALGNDIVGVLKRLEPQKATIEMGFEIGAESGQLTALLVKGTGKANLKVSLEWSKENKGV
jgi:hypothetical protein